MAKLFGGTRAGMVGATVGMIAGLFVGGLIGIVVGPFVGAVAGELLNDRERIGQALVVGVGSFLSFLVGTGIKLVCCGRDADLRRGRHVAGPAGVVRHRILG